MKNVPGERTPLGTAKFYSKIFNVNWCWLLLLLVFSAGCKKVTEEVGIVNPCPVVVSTDPADKAVDVLYNKVILATFNTNMNPATITGASFTIKQLSTATLITGKIAPGANGTIFTFTPDVPLLPFTKYTGTINTSVTDKFRTAMVNDYVWTFTTIPMVTVAPNLAAGGTVAGAGVFAQGSVTTVSAVPKAGYTFTNWTDSGATTVVSTSPSYQFTMSGNRALVANFTVIPPAKYAVVVTSNPVAGGSTFGSGSYDVGTAVTVIESPNPGYTFVNWTENGNIVSTASSYQFTLTANKTLVANFTIIPALQFALILSSSPQAGGTTTGSGAYTSGTSVVITATPSAGYTFVNWTENGNILSTSSTYTFPLMSNKTLVANFALNTYTLNVIATNGIVAKNPNQVTYTYGTPVQLTATPNAGYTFSSWSGDASGSANPLLVIMNGNKNITANFTLLPSTFMGTAFNFGAFGGNAGITNQGLNTVINNGGIGTTAASSLITGFHDGLTADIYTETPLNVGNSKGGIFTAPPAPGTAASFLIAQKALLDANAAYLSISPASKPGGIDPGAGELGGLTLAPGVYKSASGTFKIQNGPLTLDGQGDPNAQWIFQTAAGLTVGIAGPAGARSVLLINGASAKNVFWYVGSAATINAAGGGVMSGTIISTAGITFSTPGNAVQTVLNGRAISLVASVTMVNTTINNQ
ncbi:MAG: cell wall/surface repeat protein [Ferruginibacter sp.]|nr:cell wall/surface repeat protein [Ferruginibacter sp.]